MLNTMKTLGRLGLFNTIRHLATYTPRLDPVSLARYRLLRNRYEYGPTPGSKIIVELYSDKNMPSSVRYFAHFIDEHAGDIVVMSNAGNLLDAIIRKDSSKCNQLFSELWSKCFSLASDRITQKEFLASLLDVTTEYSMSEVSAQIVQKASEKGITLDETNAEECQLTSLPGVK